MNKISDLDRISSNFDAMAYELHGKIKDTVYIFKKEHSRFDIDLEIGEVRFYYKKNTSDIPVLKNVYAIPDFSEMTSDWVKKHKKDLIDG